MDDIPLHFLDTTNAIKCHIKFSYTFDDNTLSVLIAVLLFDESNTRVFSQRRLGGFIV